MPTVVERASAANGVVPVVGPGTTTRSVASLVECSSTARLGTIVVSLRPAAPLPSNQVQLSGAARVDLGAVGPSTTASRAEAKAAEATHGVWCRGVGALTAAP